MAEYTLSYRPREHVRVPFAKVFADDDAGAEAVYDQVVALRDADARASLTKKVDEKADAEVVTGAGWALILTFVTAAGKTVKFRLDHWDNDTSEADLVTLLLANITDPDGNAVVSCVEDRSMATVYKEHQDD